MKVWIFVALFWNGLEMEPFDTKQACDAAVIQAKEKEAWDTFCTERELKRSDDIGER